MNDDLAKSLIIENLQAPEVYVSGIHGAAVDGPVLHLTFASLRVSHSEGDATLARTVVNVRLVMPIEGVKNMVAFLSQFLQRDNPGALAPPPGATIN